MGSLLPRLAGDDVTSTQAICDALATMHAEHGDDWQTRAACQGANERLFFPPNGPEGQALTDRAINYCAQCPVVVECLEDALRTPPTDDYGIRGGATPADRQRIRIARRNFHTRTTRKVA